MNRPQKLLQRLQEIGESLSQREGALALLGLGSVGVEQARLDEYSDLDFFVIVSPGYKQRFIDDLSWMSSIRPLTYVFRNSVEGYKALFNDGIFLENAIFELPELATIPYAEGRWIWHVPDFDTSLSVPRIAVPEHAHTAEWLVGETVTNLYVGLMRYYRGEKLSAQRFIQHYAVDHLVDLLPHLMEAQPAFRDVFTRERRLEQRYPAFAAYLPSFIQGYERSPESAQAILAFLESHFEVSANISSAITQLIESHR